MCDSRNGEVLWKLSSSGSYSVKSGYNLSWNWKQANSPSKGESSNSAARENFWKKFWRVGVPARVKVAVWRIFHNGLPTKEGLKKRGVMTDFICMLCGQKGEDATHLFMNCWWARALWNRLDISFTDEERSDEPKGWLWSTFETKNLSDIRKVLVALWAIWSNRNAILHGNSGWCIEQSSYKVFSILEQQKKKGLCGLLLSSVENSNSDKLDFCVMARGLRFTMLEGLLLWQ